MTKSRFYSSAASPFAGLTTRYLAKMIAAGSPDREAMLEEIARREAAKKRRSEFEYDEKAMFLRLVKMSNGY